MARAGLRARRRAGSATRSTPDAHDLFYLGGGQDRDQALCARDLATVKRDALHAAAARGAVVFAVCGGLQLLGHGYELEDERLPGVGLVDLDTKREEGPRLLGNIAIALDLPGGPAMLAGFENHAGRTYLGAGAAPLGRVVEGNGNNGRDGTEGVRGGPHGTVIGTYMHGPLLPKNTAFADWLDAHGARARRAAAARRRAGGRGARRGGARRRRLRLSATPQKRIAAIAMPWAQATSSATGTCSSAVWRERDVAGPEVDGRDPGLDDERRRVAPVLHPPSRAGRPRSRSAPSSSARPARPRAISEGGTPPSSQRRRAGAPAATGRRPPRAPAILHLGLHARLAGQVLDVDLDPAARRVGDHPLAAVDRGDHRMGGREVRVARAQRPLLVEAAQRVEQQHRLVDRADRAAGVGMRGGRPAWPPRPSTSMVHRASRGTRSRPRGRSARARSPRPPAACGRSPARRRRWSPPRSPC